MIIEYKLERLLDENRMSLHQGSSAFVFGQREIAKSLQFIVDTMNQQSQYAGQLEN
jgi:hypothetical protein